MCQTPHWGFTHVISLNPHKNLQLVALIIPHFTVEKLTHKEVKGLVLRSVDTGIPTQISLTPESGLGVRRHGQHNYWHTITSFRMSGPEIKES